MASSDKTSVDLSAAMIVDPVALADWLVIAPLILCVSLGAMLVMVRKDTNLQPYLCINFIIALYGVYPSQH